jgi:hypothetical protein
LEYFLKHERPASGPGATAEMEFMGHEIESLEGVGT